MPELNQFIAAFIPGSLSLFIALIKTRDFNLSLYLKPTVNPISRVQTLISSREGHTCLDCDDLYVRPFIEISIRRLEIFAFLSSISIGLLSQCFLYLYYKNISSSISYFIWFLATAFLVFNYIIIKKDVFSWWDRNLRITLGIAMIFNGIAAAMNYPLDPMQFFFNYDSTTIFFSSTIPNSFIAALITLIILCFIVARIYFNKNIPSLRNSILRSMEKERNGMMSNGTRISRIV